MDRELYNDGVEVRGSSLKRTEDTRAFNIQRRFADQIRAGRVEGLELDLGVPASRLDVAAGHGYTSRGDLLEFAGQVNVALADYTLSAVNYFILFYREEDGDPQAHETSGTSRNTSVTRSCELRVLTSTEFDTISTTEDSDFELNLLNADLELNALDRMIVLAVVLGKGFTGLTPNVFVTSDFTNGNIEQQSAFDVQITASMPDSPTITGVNLKALDQETDLGSGTLRLTVSAGPAYTLRWTAPGDSIGSAESVTTDGVYTITSAGGQTIDVEAFIDLLTTVNGTYDDTITVEELYANTGPAFTVRDEQHRQTTGSYIPTRADPHGTGIQDFAQQVLNVIQLMRLGENFIGTEAHALLSRLSLPVSTEGERTLMFHFPTDAYDVRVYVNTSEQLEVTLNAYWDGSLWNKDDAFSSQKYVLSSRISSYQFSATSGTWNDSGWDAPNILYTGHTIESGNLLTGSAANAHIERIRVPRIPSGTANRTKLFRDDGNQSGVLLPLEVYLANTGTSDPEFGSMGACLEICSNAVVTAGDTWAYDISAVSYKLAIGRDGIQFLTTGAPTATWDDTVSSGDWQVSFRVEGWSLTSGGTIRAGQNLIVQSDGHDVMPRFTATMPMDTDERWLMTEWIDDTTSLGFREYVVITSSAFRKERAYGCFWTGTQWDADSAGQGSVKLVREGSDTLSTYTKVAPFPSPWNDVDFDACNRSFGLISITAGNMDAGSGFNYTGVIAGGGATVDITFDVPMINTAYVVAIVNTSDDGTFDSLTFLVPLAGKTEAGFSVVVMQSATGVALVLDDAGTNVSFDFQVESLG